MLQRTPSRSKKTITEWKKIFANHISDKVLISKKYIKNSYRDFPGGAVVKNPPANAGDMDSIPGMGRSHRPRSN